MATKFETIWNDCIIQAPIVNKTTNNATKRHGNPNALDYIRRPFSAPVKIITMETGIIIQNIVKKMLEIDLKDDQYQPKMVKIHSFFNFLAASLYILLLRIGVSAFFAKNYPGINLLIFNCLNYMVVGTVVGFSTVNYNQNSEAAIIEAEWRKDSYLIGAINGFVLGASLFSIKEVVGFLIDKSVKNSRLRPFNDYYSVAIQAVIVTAAALIYGFNEQRLYSKELSFTKRVTGNDKNITTDDTAKNRKDPFSPAKKSPTVENISEGEEMDDLSKRNNQQEKKMNSNAKKTQSYTPGFINKLTVELRKKKGNTPDKFGTTPNQKIK